MRIIAALFFLFPLIVQSQIALTVNLPPAGLHQTDQLWNLVLVNNGAQASSVTVVLSLKDNKSGQVIMSAESSRIEVNRGVKLITASDVQPVVYNWVLTPPLRNLLPLGTFLACYSVIQISGDRVDKVAEECVSASVDPLSPPLLMMPANHSKVNSAPIQFSWAPPAPLEMFPGITYDLTVTEVIPGQSVNEAIINNLPIFSKSNVRVLSEGLPLSSASLGNGKSFAWQVIARADNYAIPTDVWGFSVQDDTVTSNVDSYLYIELKEDTESPGLQHIQADSIHLRYYSFYPSYEASFQFLDDLGQVLEVRKRAVNYGDNWVKFDLGSKYEPGKIYKISVVDPMQVRRSVSFLIKQPN